MAICTHFLPFWGGVSCLFCIWVIQDRILLEENNTLPLVSESLGRIPNRHTTPLLWLKGTCLNLIGPLPPIVLLVILPQLGYNALCRLFHKGRKVLVNEVSPLTEFIRSTKGKIMYNKFLQAVTSVLQDLPPKDLVLLQKACNQGLSGLDKKMKEKMAQWAQLEHIQNLQNNLSYHVVYAQAGQNVAGK
ncbi:hypothetical protein VP01_1879g3 [Puccinia sorghi]|uniref:Uncharacterized protein n=1 Tax=Puccinia sorghi TaxID=27349 RepID=A0A0L6VDM1_9BASI|nr:hypothetical protein VP01_1879g3 [Puccinia sorghi]